MTTTASGPLLNGPARTKRIHDITALKAEIKAKAAEIRELRNQARATSGPDRHALKTEARELGSTDARYLLLAYGYLRGRTISQMESPATHPRRLADPDTILYNARPYFQKGPEAEPWQEEVRGENRIEVPTPDDRGFIAKMLGKPPPPPTVKVQKWVDHNDPPGWEEFVAMVTKDLDAWNSQCEINHAEKLALRRKRKAEQAEHAEVA